MSATFTVVDLMRAGGPLQGARILAGEEGLGNAVVWAVTLRPYAPTIPPMKGGEIALTGADTLARQGISQASVIERLAQLGASGFAIKGEVESDAMEAARRVTLPILKIAGETALHEIEQEIIRECVMFQARREVSAPQEPWGWIGVLVSGQDVSPIELQAQARRDGYNLPASVSVAYLVPLGNEPKSNEVAGLVASIARQRDKREPSPAVCTYEDGVLAILPPGSSDSVLAHDGWACGIGTERSLVQAAISLEEARIAALVSARLNDGAPVRYGRMGMDLLLITLYREKGGELQAFVQETLGPLLEHDLNNATQLLPTIEVFAGHAGRLRETASEIYIHRNTLAYRLERAADILGKDLKDPHTLLNIAVALRARKLLEGREAKNDSDR